MTALKTKTWPWFAFAAVFVGLGLLAVEGAAGSIILAVGMISTLGGCIRFISRNETPRDEPRVPAGHSGV